MDNKEIKKLIQESLNDAIEEIGPRTAALSLYKSGAGRSNNPDAYEGNYGQARDERGSQILKDSVTSLFSKYIGRDFPFMIKLEGGTPKKYELIEVTPLHVNLYHEEDRELMVNFVFYNKESGESEEEEQKDVIFVYSSLQDKVRFYNDESVSMNMFTANFLVKAANKIREMFYTAFPDNLEGDIKSSVKKQDFKMFSYDSNNMLNMNESNKTVKVTKEQLQQIIKEGVQKLHKKTIIENRIKQINEELSQLNEGFDKRGATYSVEFREENTPDGFPKVVITRMHESDRKRLWKLDSGVKIRGFGDMSSEEISKQFGVEGPEVDSQEIIDAMGRNTDYIWNR